MLKTRVLIIEDDGSKAQHIRRIVLDAGEVREEDIEVVPDMHGARSELRNHIYDILLLDIQIPNKYGETPVADNGIKLLQELRESDKLNMPASVIAITALDEVFSRQAPVLSERLISIVKYEKNTHNWESILKNRIADSIKANSGSRPQRNATYLYDLAIVTALDTVELDHALRVFPNSQPYNVPGDSSVYYVGQFKPNNGSSVRRVVITAAPQMGMVSTAVTSCKLLQNFRPQLLAMVGIAAGVKSRTNLGDALVAEVAWDYGSGKLFPATGKKPVFSPDPKPLHLDADMVAQVQSLKRDTAFLETIRSTFPGRKPDTVLRVHLGPLATGAAVLTDPEILKQIESQSRKLVGIDMETYGVYVAGSNFFKPRPVFISIKSVSDFADSEKKDDFQDYAAYTSASLLRKLAENFFAASGD